MPSTSSVMTAKVKEVVKQSKKKMGPCIVRFEHGALLPDSDPKFKAGLANYSFADGRADFDLTLKDAGGMVYSNRADSVKDLQSSPLMQTYLAIRDRETNEIRLVEANTVTLGAVVDPPGPTNPLLLKDGDQEEEEAKARRASMKRHLVSEFGQAKVRRIYEQDAKNKVDADVIEDKASKAALSVAEGRLAAPEAPPPPELAPPMNRAAAAPADVFSAADLLTPDEMAELEEWADALRDDFGDRDSIIAGTHEISLYMVHLLEKTLSRTGAAMRRSLSLALYAEALVKLCAFKVRDLAQGPRALMPNRLPPSVASKVFDKFTEDGRMTPESRDAALCHALVAGLLSVGDFQVEFTAIAKAFRKKPEQMKRLGLVCGATLVTDPPTGQKFLALKMPLASFDPNEKHIPAKKRKEMKKAAG